MRKLSVFNQVSVDGYFKTSSGDPGLGAPERRRSGVQGFHRGQCRWWRHAGLRQDDLRMMTSFWPTPMAAEQFPVIAKADEQPAEDRVPRKH